MTLAADIASDMAGFDFVEQVTLTPQQGSAVSGVTALRQVVSLMRLSVLGLEPRTITFNLEVNTLNGAKPVNGDRITDANNVSYRIVHVDLETLATRYCAYCVQEVG